MINCFLYTWCNSIPGTQISTSATMNGSMLSGGSIPPLSTLTPLKIHVEPVSSFLEEQKNNTFLRAQIFPLHIYDEIVSSVVSLVLKFVNNGIVISIYLVLHCLRRK